MGSITVNRTELGKALDFAQLGLSKRPVLAGMLVTVSAGSIELAAFDYETAAIAKVNGPWLRGRRQEGGNGRVLVTGAELAAVVKSLPKGKNVTAELSVYDDGLIVVCDGIEATLSSLPLDEYPALPPLPAESGVISAEAFARSVARVAACAGTDDTLPALTCVKLTGEAGSLELAATDRYRLAVDRVTWTGPDGADALVSAKALTAFARKADKHGKISLHLDAERAGFSDGTRTLITRNCPAEFPKRIREHIPADDALVTRVLADAAELGAAVTRAGKLLARNMPVHLDITEDGITVLATDGGEVKGSQTVAAALDGPPITARFNPPYLASVLAGVDGEAWIGFTSASKPVLVTSPDGFTGICMPIRLGT